MTTTLSETVASQMASHVAPQFTQQIAPHGGTLVQRVLTGATREAALERAASLPSATIDAWTRSDLEVIATGAFSPLTGFLGERDYNTVLTSMRLANGTPWSLPITLRVDDATPFRGIGTNEVALRDEDGTIVALLEVSGVFDAPQDKEAHHVYKTVDTDHPGVARLLALPKTVVSGDVWLLDRTTPPFPALAHDPVDTRRIFAERGWNTVVGFQTRNPIHRAHEYIQKAALETVDGLLLHPLVGTTKGDDVPASVRVKSYEALLREYYPKDRVLLAAYPASMRYAGPREAIVHAIARQNYGCTHFIVGRDHAGVGSYYGTYDAQRIFEQFGKDELAIQTIRFEHTFYCSRCESVASSKTCPHPTDAHVSLSGTKVRELLRAGELPPREFSRPEVARVLAEGYAPYGRTAVRPT